MSDKKKEKANLPKKIRRGKTPGIELAPEDNHVRDTLHFLIFKFDEHFKDLRAIKIAVARQGNRIKFSKQRPRHS